MSLDPDRKHHPPMDVIGPMLFAIGAFALLQVAAVGLRGEERHARSTRPVRRPRGLGSDRRTSSGGVACGPRLDSGGDRCGPRGQPLRPRRRHAVLRGARRPVLRRRRDRPAPAAVYPEPDLAGARHRLTLFLAQYWGGPTTYDAERGHPRLRMRHAPFAIGPAERDAWLGQMRAAIAAAAPPPDVAARAPRATSTWPPRRCATATEPVAGPAAAARYTGRRRSGRRRATIGGGGAGWRHRRRRRRSEPAPSRRAGRPAARQDGPRRGRERRPPGPRPGRRRGRGLPRDRAQGASAGPLGRRSARPAGASPDAVVVLDFGSQFAQLIARRVRELDVYSELLPHDTPCAEIERRGPAAIILSGGPNSVYDERRPEARRRPSGRGRIPVLGHLLRRPADGPRARRRRPRRPTQREYGPANVTITDDDGLFAGLDRDQPVWMSHGDSITRLPEGFSRDRPDRLDAVRRPRRRRPATSTASSSIPRSSTRPRGRDVLRNFVVGIAGATPTWTPANFIDTTVAGIRERVDAPRARRPAPTAWSSAPCRAASTRPSRPRSSTARSAIG